MHVVEPNEDFGPTPNVPSVISVRNSRESEIRFEQQITAGSEGKCPLTEALPVTFLSNVRKEVFKTT